MAEYRYYLIPDAMTRAFPEQFEKQTPTEFFDNIADLEKRYHQLREMPYNNERTWNERARFPYARLVVGVDRQNPDGEVAVIQVRNGINYLCDDYRGPYADGSDTQIPQMAKKLVEVIGVDRVRPHTYTQRDGYTWVQVEKDMHITEWLYAHELCSSLQFTRFLNRDGRELFQVRDGQRVIETNSDGTKRIRAVKSIDVTHAYVGHYGCHIQQYADANFKSGCYVAPEHPQPGDNLDKLQIYQVTKGGCEYRFMNYAYSKSRIHAADYSSVYIANLPADYDLDRCFQEFNAPNRPLRYHMDTLMSLQMSDPIAQHLGSWSQEINVLSICLRIALAVFLTSVIGCERSSKRHSAGLRTFVLISFSSTICMILDIYLMQTQAIDIPILSAATMISAASISGKSILFSSRGQIKGLTTSAALWSCAALGFTIGAGLYTVTLIVFAFLLCILSAFPTIEVYLKNRSNHFEIHLELKNIEYLRDFVTVSRRLGLRIDDIESNPAYVGSGLSVYTITVTICSSELKKYKTHHEIIEALKSLDYIYHLEELR